MDAMIQSSKLSEHCRADLRRLLKTFEKNSEAVRSPRQSYNHVELPRCVGLLTSAKAAITKPPLFASANGVQRQVPRDWPVDPALSRGEKKMLQSVDARLRASTAPRKRFSALPLSPKEQEFIYRYAEHKHSAKIHRTEESHQMSNAYRAYTQAFLSFMGRPPSTTELQEADRLTFVESTGRVGIIAHPHAPTPHRHISNVTAAVTSCGHQVLPPEKPLVRAARPGSTLIDRVVFSPQTSLAASPKSGSPQRSSQASSPLKDRPTTAKDFASVKKFCRVCNARLPPRLIKTVCPSCDA